MPSYQRRSAGSIGSAGPQQVGQDSSVSTMRQRGGSPKDQVPGRLLGDGVQSIDHILHEDPGQGDK